ncbi:putative molybdopterin binding domain-containing protein [Thermodesulfobium acidiphilum]|uniref:Putative molybdopterin binding domain-containing protein n=1 Tax=Thermodesulfobium acidiphilum TaxID=1794699 RepID=A0A2R4W2W7_THEAF|nr:molybdopterin-binding protein [Thermodesulfobium acidiphilum]AWB11094.1 putative molybdopterin binding domain-containing protein [Thermodesulfobium acidiphilum]
MYHSKRVPIEESVGMTLGYDLTRIIPGKHKEAVFRRGHVITADDIPILKEIGKDFIWDLKIAEDELHEDEAALRLARAISGDNLIVKMPGEAWADVIATKKGLFKVRVRQLDAINSRGDTFVATLKSNTVVEEGRIVAKAKVQGLVVKKREIELIEGECKNLGKVLTLHPFISMKVGLIVTGSEIYYGRKEDSFTPLIVSKVAKFNSEVFMRECLPDDPDLISNTILKFVQNKAQVIIITGGMSPDDVSAEGVRRSGAAVVSYGAPLSPGAMFLVAYFNDIPIFGIPGGALRFEPGAFDLFGQLAFAGLRITFEMIRHSGHGGLLR